MVPKTGTKQQDVHLIEGIVHIHVDTIAWKRQNVTLARLLSRSSAN